MAKEDLQKSYEMKSNISIRDELQLTLKVVNIGFEYSYGNSF
jgi:hypothetical protein